MSSRSKEARLAQSGDSAPAAAKEPTAGPEEISRNPHYFQALFESASDAIVVFGPEGQFLDANPAACKLTGFDRDELIGRSVTETIETSTDFAAAWNKFLKERTYRGQRWLVRSDGTRRLIEIRATAHVLPGQHLAAWRDVTSRYFLESELPQRERNEALIRLASGIAHNLTNLLHVIGGHAELMTQNVTHDSELQAHIDRIIASTKQAAELSTQLSALGRQQVISPAVLDLGSFVQSTREVLGNLLPEKVDLVLQSEPTLLIHADRTQMAQILITLVSAAGEQVPDHSRLMIKVCNTTLMEHLIKPGARVPAGNYVVLELKSESAASGAHHGTRPLRASFPQSRQERNRPLPAITATLHQNGGVLWIDEDIAGVSYRIYFPPATGRALAMPAFESGTKLGGSETLLLAEDDPALREATREYLKCLGYRVLRASNGEEALHIAHAEGNIDALVTDLKMPKMGGRELAEKLSVLRPDLKVMFVSGNIDRELVDPDAPQQSALLTKPFAMRALAKMLRELLDGRGKPSA